MKRSWEWLKKAGVVAAWLVGGGALLAVVAASSFFIAMRLEMSASQVAVPDLLGDRMEDAEGKAADLGLVLDVVEERYDPAVASGRVLQQQPAAGSQVRRGRKLKVVRSLGGKVLDVPGLEGRRARQAEIELRQEGFGLGDEARVYSRAVESGEVMAQVPPPRSPAVPGTRVHRLISGGPLTPRWVMPDLTGRPAARVDAWIAQSGFRKGPVRRVSSARNAPGTVVGQFPLAGYPIRAKDVVELTVAR